MRQHNPEEVKLAAKRNRKRDAKRRHQGKPKLNDPPPNLRDFILR